MPKSFGGHGETWPNILEIVREIAKADSSLGHVFGYHFLQSVSPYFFGTSEQRDYFYKGTAEHNWFWGNAINPRDKRLTVTQDGAGYRLNGIKYFCSGSQDSDILVVCAEFPEEHQPRIFAVPTKRDGITVHDDWEGIGQRQTDSGTVSFDNVWVEKHEFLETPGIGGSTLASLRTCLTQLIMTNVFVGIAQGAFAEAQKYTRSYTRSWVGEKATEDPLILRHYGELWAQLSAAEQLTNKAAQVFQ